MSGVRDLSVVETIYEEEGDEVVEEFSTYSCVSAYSEETSSFSHSFGPLQMSLHDRVEEWTRTTGLKTDVIMIVGDARFYLHKEPLTTRSLFLRSLFKESGSRVSVTTLPSQINISALTFATVADYCYIGEEALTLTPFNITSLRIASDHLKMASLGERTEEYFCESIAAGPEFAATVLRSCLQGFHPAEDEKAAVIAGRCVEELAAAASKDDGDAHEENRGMRNRLSSSSWLVDVVAIQPPDFQAIVGTIRQRLADSNNNHDLLYDIIAFYVENHVGYIKEKESLSHEDNAHGKQEEEIFSLVDCRKLSRRRLVELVRNPRMPLRFVVQAMMTEHLRTRRALLNQYMTTVMKNPEAADYNCMYDTGNYNKGGTKLETFQPQAGRCATLGTFLQHDASLRQASLLKEAMEAASLRIQALEDDLAAMRRQLKGVAGMDQPARSASLRALISTLDEGRNETRIAARKKPNILARSLGRMLMYGIRNAFRTTSPTAEPSCERSRSSGWAVVNDGEEEDRDVDVDSYTAGTAASEAASAMRDDMRRFDHRRSHSFA